MVKERCANKKWIKIILILILSPVIVSLSLLLGFFLFWGVGDYLWPQFTSGTMDLGGGFYVHYRDPPADVGIWRGSFQRGKASYGGSEFIPVESHKGNDCLTRRSVIDVRKDDRWIIAVDYDFKGGDVHYFVIDKSFDEDCDDETIKEQYFHVFDDIRCFKDYCSENHITLNFESGREAMILSRTR